MSRQENSSYMKMQRRPNWIFKMGEMEETEERIFCPRCKSVDVRIEITPSSAFGAPQGWICNNCGYKNVVFPKLIKLKTEGKNGRRKTKNA
jgi:hypothetical protein